MDKQKGRVSVIVEPGGVEVQFVRPAKESEIALKARGHDRLVVLSELGTANSDTGCQSCKRRFRKAAAMIGAETTREPSIFAILFSPSNDPNLGERQYCAFPVEILRNFNGGGAYSGVTRCLRMTRPGLAPPPLTEPALAALTIENARDYATLRWTPKA